MTHGHTRIDSKEICIYCKRSGLKLTDEHIVPFFLGGAHVICKASCDNCAKITSKFERDVARGIWGDARNSYNAPSRRKKKRKKYIFLEDRYNPEKKLKIPFNEYPAPMIFYQMNAAGILLGHSEEIDHSRNWKLKAIVDENKLQDFERKYPGQLTAKFKHAPDSFARLIAKIGYGQILCSLDPDDFNPICLPYILGKRTNLSYVVGGRYSIPEPKVGIGYELTSHSFGTSNKLLIIAEVRLIADNHTPIYHVVVGNVTGKERVDSVTTKLQSTYSVKIPDTTENEQNPEDKFHWMPRVWPLPIWGEVGRESNCERKS